MDTSYHVHSQWSDGKSSLAELHEAAIATGLAEWGISDHIVMHPRGIPVGWSMDPGRLPSYVAAVHAQQAQCLPGDPPLRLGLELDYFPGQEKTIADLLDGHRFEYLLGAVHYVDGFCVDNDLEGWKRMSASEVDDVWRGYWARICGLARSGMFTCIAHLDLPKAFAFMPTADLRREREEALNAIARAGLAIEVNAAGFHRACEEAYPSIEILRACRSLGIPAQVNADAHHARDLGRGLDRGREWLASAGYREVVRFGGHGLRSFPMH